MQGTNNLLHDSHPDQEGTKGPLTGKKSYIVAGVLYINLNFFYDSKLQIQRFFGTSELLTGPIMALITMS